MQVPGVATFTVDIACGGNFYAVVEPHTIFCRRQRPASSRLSTGLISRIMALGLLRFCS
ncbi:proline racemase family protein [Pseudomonas sp. FP1742]|nr:proline racemase family protein [Pseudomonas sp. FP1742]WLG48197.1 proline racemase family protein [Pseudomonas sp. FP1742]